MHYFLLGATGRTGKHVVSELLSQGHTATALVRRADSLSPQAGLTTFIGSPLSKDDIRNALAVSPHKPAAAIVTLNTVRKSDSPFAAQLSPPRFLADSCANICEILEEAGIRRIVIMSTAGAGSSWNCLPLLSKAFMGWTNVKHALNDHNLVDAEIRQTRMDWTLVRAVRLVFDDPKQEQQQQRQQQKSSVEKKDVKTLGSDGQGMILSDSITVSCAAQFLVKVAVEGSFVREAIVVTN